MISITFPKVAGSVAMAKKLIIKSGLSREIQENCFSTAAAAWQWAIRINVTIINEPLSFSPTSTFTNVRFDFVLPPRFAPIRPALIRPYPNNVFPSSRTFILPFSHLPHSLLSPSHLLPSLCSPNQPQSAPAAAAAAYWIFTRCFHRDEYNITPQNHIFSLSK